MCCVVCCLLWRDSKGVVAVFVACNCKPLVTTYTVLPPNQPQLPPTNLNRHQLPPTAANRHNQPQPQAEGKKRMKALGKVEVPQAAFMAVLKINE